MHLLTYLLADVNALQLDQSLQLVELNLAGNLLGDESLQRIARQLPTARSITRLNVYVSLLLFFHQLHAHAHTSFHA